MEREIKGDSLRITRKTRCSKRANEKHLNKYINYVYALCALRFISEWEGRCERGRELKLHTDTNWRTLVCVSCCFDTLLCDVVNFVFFFLVFSFWFCCSFPHSFIPSSFKELCFWTFHRDGKKKTSWKFKHMFARFLFSLSNQTFAFQLDFRFQVLIEFVFQFLLPPPPPSSPPSLPLLLPVFM